MSLTEERVTCEDKIDAELEHELEQVRAALEVGRVQYRLRCDGCGHEWETDDEFEDCPECDDCAEFPEVLDEDESEETQGSYMEEVLEITQLHIVYRISLSCGGPADGFLLYVNPLDKTIEYVVYYYSDWFDYAERRLSESGARLVKDMFESYIQLE